MTSSVAAPVTPAAGCPPADERDLTGVLRRLAKSSAVAVVTGAGASIEQPGGSPGAASRPTPIAPQAWRDLVSRGWVVPGGDAGGWRISNAGRIALRRRLTRSGPPEADGGARRSGGGATAATPVPQRSTAIENDAECPLVWLSRRRDKAGRPHITQTQLAAGERLRRDFTIGSLAPSITANWSPVAIRGTRHGGSDRELELRDSQLQARDRYRSALAAVGPEFAGILVDVCCYLKGLETFEKAAGWPQRTAKVVLRLALDALARHYGLGQGRTRT